MGCGPGWGGPKRDTQTIPSSLSWIKAGVWLTSLLFLLCFSRAIPLKGCSVLSPCKCRAWANRRSARQSFRVSGHSSGSRE
eukprot:4261993-Lingulodinium_polyedra.AAC.1